MLVSLASARGSDVITLDEVVANVAANESLYDNVEFAFTRRLELLRDVNDAASKAILSEYSNRRAIYQNGMIYVSDTRNGQTAGSNSFEHSLVAGYDGQDSRICSDGVANIRSGMLVIPRRYFLHALLLERAHIRKAKLSEFLSRVKSIRGDDLRVAVDGVENVNSLRCIRLRMDSGKGSGSEWRMLWLAVDRNYLPAKSVAYAAAYSKSIPLEEGIVKSWREVEPGIWSLGLFEIISNYELAARRGEIVRSNRLAFEVKNVNLHPDYDANFFRDIEMPDGTVVFHVNKKNEVIPGRTAIVGTSAGDSRGIPAWLVLANLIGIPLVIVLIACVRRCRSLYNRSRIG